MQFGPFETKINKTMKRKTTGAIVYLIGQFVSLAIQVGWLYCTAVLYCTNFVLGKLSPCLSMGMTYLS